MSESLHTRWSMLERLRGSDAEAAWRWFVEHYRDYVRSCLRRFLVDPALRSRAEDEIWSHLFSSDVFGLADRGRRFRPYLTGVVRNFARSWLRAEQGAAGVRHARAGGGHEAAIAAVDMLLREDQEARLWARHVLRLAFLQLVARQPRRAEALRRFYGLEVTEDGVGFGATESVSSIARSLDIEPNAVHQDLYRGRNELRAAVEDELRQTVRDSESLDEEVRCLFVAVSDAPGLLS